MTQTDDLRQLGHQMLVPINKLCKNTTNKNTLRHATVSETGSLLFRAATDNPAAFQYFQCQTKCVVSDPKSFAQPETHYADQTLIPPEPKHHDCILRNRLQLSIRTKKFQQTYLSLR